MYTDTINKCAANAARINRFERSDKLGFWLSSAAHRLRIALNLKGLTPDFHPVHLRRRDQGSEAYLALNPQGLVPALEIEGAVLTQSPGFNGKPGLASDQR